MFIALTTTNRKKVSEMVKEDDMSQRSYSWSEMAELTHAKQVQWFNWCSCEDADENDYPYDDCKGGE